MIELRNMVLAVAVLCIMLPGPRAAAADAGPTAPSDWAALPPPDQSDWSPKRIAKYAELEGVDMGQPHAILSVPSLRLDVPIYTDSDPKALEAGAAWVRSTTAPGADGNIAIAGHRDSFFRPLEDVPLGTRVYLNAPKFTQVFRVFSVEIVDALDVTPLADADEAILTLITCYPFRYQGYAPDRYIVRAQLIEEEEEASAIRRGQVGKPQSPAATINNNGVTP